VSRTRPPASVAQTALRRSDRLSWRSRGLGPTTSKFYNVLVFWSWARQRRRQARQEWGLAVSRVLGSIGILFTPMLPTMLLLFSVHFIRPSPTSCSRPLPIWLFSTGLRAALSRSRCSSLRFWSMDVLTLMNAKTPRTKLPAKPQRTVLLRQHC
jgi:hypothetical protein